MVARPLPDRYLGHAYTPSTSQFTQASSGLQDDVHRLDQTPKTVTLISMNSIIENHVLQADARKIWASRNQCRTQEDYTKLTIDVVSVITTTWTVTLLLKVQP